jgi:citrate synthase
MSTPQSVPRRRPRKPSAAGLLAAQSGRDERPAAVPGAAPAAQSGSDEPPGAEPGSARPTRSGGAERPVAAPGAAPEAAAAALLSAADAARQLGVKVETVYAYVSRGLLTRREHAAASGFDPGEVARLCARARRGQAPKPTLLLVASQLTEIMDQAIYYRGRDVTQLALELPFERVAEWLWGAPAAESRSFVAPKAAVALARAVQNGMPDGALPLERLRVIAAVLGSADALRYETSQAAAVATARALIAGMIDALPRVTLQPIAANEAAPLSGRLWSRLTQLRPNPARLRALDAAMGLCADHALSPSTLAVRIAASQRADPYSLIQTGLGALGGALHGAASLSAEELLQEVERGADPASVIGARLRRGERIAGFGHGLHPSGDPRASTLLALLPEAFAHNRALDAAQRVREVMSSRGLPAPNIDFALAALARTAQMQHGASEAIMAVCRSAGWIAHALEEYASPTAFPWRTLYIGPPAQPARS